MGSHLPGSIAEVLPYAVGPVEALNFPARCADVRAPALDHRALSCCELPVQPLPQAHRTTETNFGVKRTVAWLCARPALRLSAAATLVAPSTSVSNPPVLLRGRATAVLAHSNPNPNPNPTPLFLPSMCCSSWSAWPPQAAPWAALPSSSLAPSTRWWASTFPRWGGRTPDQSIVASALASRRWATSGRASSCTFGLPPPAARPPTTRFRRPPSHHTFSPAALASNPQSWQRSPTAARAPTPAGAPATHAHPPP